MGRELVIKKIKKSATGLIIAGVIFVLFSIVFAMIYASDDALLNGLFIIVIFLLVGVPMLFFGIRDLINPLKNGLFKRNPYIIEQVDNMLSNIRYEDKFIKLSDRCIANKKSITEIAYLEDVFLVYIQKQSTNFIPTGKLLLICTATGNISINVYGVKKAIIDELADKISKICPNARFGYNNEGLAYLKQMQQLYKNNNGMINHKGIVQNIYVLPEYLNNANMQNQYINQYDQYNQSYYMTQNVNYGQGYDQNTLKQ